jgi:hypothetical protein
MPLRTNLDRLQDFHRTTDSGLFREVIAVMRDVNMVPFFKHCYELMS